MSGIKGQRYDEWHSRTFAIPSNCGFLYHHPSIEFNTVAFSIARPHPYATISIMASINQLRALARPSKASTSGASPNPTCWIPTRWNSMTRIYQITDCGKTVSDEFNLWIKSVYQCVSHRERSESQIDGIQ
eukprot:111981_1